MELLINELNKKHKDYLIVFIKGEVIVYRTKQALIKNVVEDFKVTGHHRVGSLTSKINGIIDSDINVAYFATKNNLS